MIHRTCVDPHYCVCPRTFSWIVRKTSPVAAVDAIWCCTITVQGCRHLYVCPATSATRGCGRIAVVARCCDACAIHMPRCLSGLQVVALTNQHDVVWRRSMRNWEIVMSMVITLSLGCQSFSALRFYALQSICTMVTSVLGAHWSALALGLHTFTETL